MTLKDYILHWQEVYDKKQSRPTTYAAHGYLFKNHILPRLGEIPLEELTAEQVGDFLEERKRFGGHRPESPEYPGLGEHTMRHIHRLLQQCLDQAIRDGLIRRHGSRPIEAAVPARPWRSQYTELCRAAAIFGIAGSVSACNLSEQHTVRRWEKNAEGPSWDRG